MRRDSSGIWHGAVVSTLWCMLIVAVSVAGCGATNGGARFDAGVLRCLEHEGFGVHDDTVSQAPSEATTQQIRGDLDACGVKVKQVSEAIAKNVTNVLIERELRRNVDCIRKHGFGVTAGHDLTYKPFDAAGVDTNLPAFRHAVRVCRRKFTEAIRILDPGAVPEGTEGAFSGSMRVGNAGLAKCVRRFGGTVVYAQGVPGVRVPRNIPSDRLEAMLGSCDVSSAELAR